MKKLFPALAVLIVIALAIFVNYDRLSKWFPTDFSETEMVFENDGSTRYYYDALSEDAKIAYTKVLSEIRSHPEKIEIPDLTDTEFDEMFCALSYDNPELLCMKNESKIQKQGAKAYFLPQYYCSAEECEQHRTEMEACVEKLLADVPENLTDYEKELYFHDWICSHFTYETEDSAIGYTTYDGFVLGRAVCEAYSRCMQLLLNRSGIPNYLATGTGVDIEGKSEGHMWNVVTLDGKNYYLDVTWDDLDAAEIGQYCHAFFNVSEKDIAENHLGILPQGNNCVSDDANYFVVSGLMFETYDNAAKSKITQEISDAVAAGTNAFEIRFSNDEAYFAALDALTQDGEIYALVERAGQKASRVCNEALYVQDDSMRTIQFAFQ